jgi:alkanesulfonate monooxygenase SsuD/methylene tetrahydromethanopterin reductase-like flavin-dependent oxidoreductase (luciferase family)
MLKLGLHYSFQTADADSRSVIDRGLREIEIADRDGFSAAVFAEHHFAADGWIPRPMLLAAAAAARTSRLAVGTNIVVLALHHPVAVAEEAALLDVLSGGRAVLGVGLGWIPTEFAGFGVPYRQRVKVFVENVRAVRSLLAGERTSSVDGAHWEFENAQVTPRLNRVVPIRAGAVEEVAVRRVATLADAWTMPPMPTISTLRGLKLMFDEVRAEAGLPPVTEQPMRREVFVAESAEAAWHAFAPGLRHEYGKVYRQWDPTYPANDTVTALRSWGEDNFPVGPPDLVAEQLKRNATELDVTEALVRYQLPGISDIAARDCFEGLREVCRLLGNDRQPQPAAVTST